MKRIATLIVLIAIVSLMMASVASAGQIQRVWYPDAEHGWVASPLVSGTYVSVCSRPNDPSCYAARAGGGVDWVNWFGTWTASRLGNFTTKYVDLSRQQDNSGFFAGVREDGGVDWIAWSGSAGTWVNVPLVNGNYVSICPKSTGNEGWYAARADDGVDWIRYDGAWGVSPVIRGVKYTDLAADPRGNGFFCGVASGGIDWISYDGTAMVADRLVNGSYNSVAFDSAVAAPNIALWGAKTNGGLDHIAWDGVTQAWTTIQRWDGIYSSICEEANGSGSCFGITESTSAPEISIADAKQKPNGIAVKCTGTVTAAGSGGSPIGSGHFYIESIDRSMGIRVKTVGAVPFVGHTVTISGFTDTVTAVINNIAVGGERFIFADQIIQDEPGDPIRPLMLTTKNLGAGSFGDVEAFKGQIGVENGVGLNNVGLLVRVTGRVTDYGAKDFSLDDGNGVSRKIIDNTAFLYADIGNYVSITGIVSMEYQVDPERVLPAILYLSGELIQSAQ